MTLIMTLISALLPVVVGALQKVTGLSPATVSLIDGIGAAGATLTSTLTSSPQTSTSVLAALGATITVLQSELAGNAGAPTALIYLSAFEQAVGAGVTAANITAVVPASLEPVAAA